MKRDNAVHHQIKDKREARLGARATQRTSTGSFSRGPDLGAGGRDCRAAGRDSCCRRWEKLQISLEIPLISSGYTIAPGCQLNARAVKAKDTCKSLRPNPWQCCFERKKAHFCSLVNSADSGYICSSLQQTRGKLTLSARRPRAAAGSPGQPLPLVAAPSWRCWRWPVAPNPAPPCPKPYHGQDAPPMPVEVPSALFWRC